MGQDPGIDHQQLFTGSWFSPQHDPAEANLGVDGPDEFRQLGFAHAAVQGGAQLAQLGIIRKGFQGREMQFG